MIQSDILSLTLNSKNSSIDSFEENSFLVSDGNFLFDLFSDYEDNYNMPVINKSCL